MAKYVNWYEKPVSWATLFFAEIFQNPSMPILYKNARMEDFYFKRKPRIDCEKSFTIIVNETF